MARKLNLDPSQCVILRYNAGCDSSGNPRRCYVVKRIDLDYMYTVAAEHDSYDGFDALVDVLDYRYQGPSLENGRFSPNDHGTARVCWDRRREWERRVIDEVTASATRVKQLVKAHREQEAWEEKEAAAGRRVR